MLFVTVLPKGAAMSHHRYSWIIQNRFPKWLAKACGKNRSAFLLQDHEKCLWSAEARSAMRQQCISLLENYPKRSQDLKPIETVWRELRVRLAVTAPYRLEDRDSFIIRLRAAVS